MDSGCCSLSYSLLNSLSSTSYNFGSLWMSDFISFCKAKLGFSIGFYCFDYSNLSDYISSCYEYYTSRIFDKWLDYLISSKWWSLSVGKYTDGWDPLRSWRVVCFLIDIYLTTINKY